MHPKHKPNDETRAKVQALCCVGVTQEMIARVLEISRPTLEKYYRDELDLAVAKANGSIANALYQQAISGNVTAMIFWLKTRARWREKDDSPATPWADAAEEVRKDAETARELLEYIKYGEGAAGSKKPS